ncbi:MAG: molecular chaperone GrpE [Solirubrobacteraceae bacterium]|jgi:molecular chaperone GrpE|nr:molecular chaperone GrpE [Solirubrobacteraceae bacterium]
MSDEPVTTDELEPEDAAVEETAAPEPELEVKLEPDPLAEAEARAQEYLELAKRKQAEFENFRKRMSGQAAQAEDRGVSKLAKELLVPLDHLELALAAAEQHAEAADWVKGIRSVQDEFKTALGRAGIEAFVPLGEVFDPNVHEAMAHAPIEGKASGTVAEVYQAGYRLASGAIIRPARVVVAQ